MLHGKLCGNHIYIQYLYLNSTKPNINPAAQNFSPQPDILYTPSYDRPFRKTFLGVEWKV